MKKLLAALGILVLLFPSRESVELGTLRPVELVYIHREGDMLWIETDTEDRGRGRDLAAALENLKETSQGEIFLATADYLLLGPGTEDALEELSDRIRPGAQAALAHGEQDPQLAAGWLRTHPSGCTLRQMGERQPPVITVTEGRYGFETK